MKSCPLAAQAALSNHRDRPRFRASYLSYLCLCQLVFLHIPPTSLSYRSMDRTPVAAPLQAGTKKPPSRRLQSRWLRVSFEEIPAFSKPDRETREIPDDADACSDGRQKFQHRTESSDCRSHITDFTGIGHFGNLALISARLSRQVPAETSPACSSKNSVSASS